LNPSEENLGELVVTRGDGPEMLELVEETLNQIAFAVEGEIACARGFSVRFGWDDWGDRSIVEGGDEGVGVEGLVGDQSAGRDGFDQRFGTSEIVILARAEHHLDGIAEGIDERVNLGRQSAAGSADGLRTVFFWAPALCWWARTIVASIIMYSLSWSLAKSLKTRAKTPLLAHRLKR